MKNESKTKVRYVLFLLFIINTSLLPVQVSRGSQSQAGAGRLFRAGAAASNITPPLDRPIIGGWNSPPGEHVHDELYARCLVLDDGTTRLAFVICDNLGIGRSVYDKARRIIGDKTGIGADHMMMAATHTHSSISARGANRLAPDGELSDYQQFLVGRIADGVRRAVNNLEPARIGFGGAAEPAQVFNRRYFMKPGVPVPNPFGGRDKVVMNPGRGNPNILKAAAPTDPEIAFLSVQSADGRPIALLANYSLHYVGGGERGAISADYFGMFSDRIQQLLGADRIEPPFVGILSNGTSGDINNINWLQKPQRKFAPYEKMRQVADLVADAVLKAHGKVEFHDWVRLGAMRNELTLAVRKPTAEQIDYARKILDKPEDARPYHEREKVYAQRVLQMHESPDEVSVVLQAFRIGELGICAIPFEVFVEIGLQIKAKSPFERTFTISHANGSYGYLPTVAQHKLGGYETWLGTSTVEVEAGPKITRTLLGMFDRLR
ncbi:MAG: neutral/alkaline non-lysosomal ceramidase N-terminal domain-containing protein [Phycisphaerae bacterium]|nr:neutral/alkaline non-lysosomal ceramidase N-terminal domain-containing protein [Phycisphaerae bacterium]